MEENKKYDFEIDLKDCRIEKGDNERVFKCKIIEPHKSKSVLIESCGK